jgi:hypothetical protein
MLRKKIKLLKISTPIHDIYECQNNNFIKKTLS